MAVTIITNALVLTAPDRYYKCNISDIFFNPVVLYSGGRIEYKNETERDIRCNEDSNCDAFQCTQKFCTYLSFINKENLREVTLGNDFCKKRDVPSSSEAPIHIATTKPLLPKSTTAAPVKPTMAPPLQNYPPPTSVTDISSPSAPARIFRRHLPYPPPTPVKDISSSPAKHIVTTRPPLPKSTTAAPVKPATAAPVTPTTAPPLPNYPPSTSVNDITSPYTPPTPVKNRTSPPAKDISSPPAEYTPSTPSTVEAERKKGVVKEVTKTCKNDWKRSNRNCTEPAAYDEAGSCPSSGCEAIHCCKAPDAASINLVLAVGPILLGFVAVSACIAAVISLVRG